MAREEMKWAHTSMLSGLIFLLCVFVGLLLWCGYTFFNQTPSAEVDEQSSSPHQVLSQEIVKDIIYIKDERTGLCFAYYWGGSSYGGPALANVPCETVPTSLLVVVKKPVVDQHDHVASP